MSQHWPLRVILSLYVQRHLCHDAGIIYSPKIILQAEWFNLLDRAQGFRMSARGFLRPAISIPRSLVHKSDNSGFILSWLCMYVSFTTVSNIDRRDACITENHWKICGKHWNNNKTENVRWKRKIALSKLWNSLYAWTKCGIESHPYNLKWSLSQLTNYHV